MSPEDSARLESVHLMLLFGVYFFRIFVCNRKVKNIMALKNPVVLIS